AGRYGLLGKSRVDAPVRQVVTRFDGSRTVVGEELDLVGEDQVAAVVDAVDPLLFFGHESLGERDIVARFAQAVGDSLQARRGGGGIAIHGSECDTAQADGVAI